MILGQDPYHGAGQAEGLAFTAAQSDEQVPDAAEEGDEDGEDRAELDDDDVVVGDAFHRHRATFAIGDALDGDIRKGGHTERSVGDDHVAGRADREELRDAFDGAGDQGPLVGELAAHFLRRHRRPEAGKGGQGGEQPEAEGEAKHGGALGFRRGRGKESRQKPLSLALE